MGLRAEHPPGGPAAPPQDPEAPRAGCSGSDRAHFTSLSAAHMFKMAALSYRRRTGARDQRNVPKVPGRPSRSAAGGGEACPTAPERWGCTHPQKTCHVHETHSPEIWSGKEEARAGRGVFHQHHLELPHVPACGGKAHPVTFQETEIQPR